MFSKEDVNVVISFEELSLFGDSGDEEEVGDFSFNMAASCP